MRVVLTPISRPMSAPVRKVFSPPTVGTLAASDCANGATSMEEKEKRKEKAYKSQYTIHSQKRELKTLAGHNRCDAPSCICVSVTKVDVTPPQEFIMYLRLSFRLHRQQTT